MAHSVILLLQKPITQDLKPIIDNVQVLIRGSMLYQLAICKITHNSFTIFYLIYQA